MNTLLDPNNFLILKYECQSVEIGKITTKKTTQDNELRNNSKILSD